MQGNVVVSVIHECKSYITDFSQVLLTIIEDEIKKNGRRDKKVDELRKGYDIEMTEVRRFIQIAERELKQMTEMENSMKMNERSFCRESIRQT